MTDATEGMPEAKPDGSEPTPEIRPEVQPEVQAEIRPEVRPEVQAEIRPEVRPEPSPEILAEAPKCARGQTLCGMTCEILTDNNAHCGSCGKACGAKQRCFGVQCQDLPYVTKYVSFRTDAQIKNKPNPSGLAFDSQGNLYVSDHPNHRLYKVAPIDIGKDLGGSAIFAGTGVSSSTDDPDPKKATLSYPRGLTIDGTDHLYLADSGSHKIRKIATRPPGVSTWAGTGSSGLEEGPLLQASFHTPRDIVLVPGVSEIGFIADAYNHRVRAIREVGPLQKVESKTEFTGLSEPSGIAYLQGVGLFVADHKNHRILWLSSALSNQSAALLAGGSSGFVDAQGGAAKFDLPRGLAVEATSPPGGFRLFVADENNHCIRAIDEQGRTTTFAGVCKQSGNAGGAAKSARFNKPWMLHVDKEGHLYVADSENSTVWKIWRN